MRPDEDEMDDPYEAVALASAEEAERDRRALRVLAKAMYRGGDFWGAGLDSSELCDAMEAAGLIGLQAYYPEIHGDDIDADRGDEIYFLTDYGREILK